MKIKKIFMLTLICLFACFGIAYAEEAAITCTTQIDGQNVSISGQIPNATTTNQVTLLVGTPDNIIYINQTKSNANGEFSFNFPLSPYILSGTYNYKIGSDSDALIYEGTLDYISPFVVERKKFIDADVDISIRGYVPTISGTVSCAEGKTLTINIANVTDSTIIGSETITSETGVFNLSYTLPSLLIPREYEITLSCTEDNVSLADMSVTIDSSILTLDITGIVATADKVDVEASLQSVNTSLLDEQTTFSGRKRVSVTVPNILASCSFHLSTQGYQTVAYEIEEYSVCTINLDNSNEIMVLAIGNNVSSFENKTFELTYDSEKVKPIKLYGLYPENELGTGQIDNIEILSHESGQITFRVTDTQIPDGKYRNGVINIFRFKNISAEAISTDIQFRAL